MSNRGPIHWGNALAALKADRAVRSEIREERLRSTAGLRGTPVLPLTAWRGRSGRRYIAGIHPVAVDSFEGQWDAVVLAVHRTGSGNAEIVDVACNVGIGKALAWITAARAAGATELHIHRLAETVKERVDAVSDLTGAL
jgi:hypothetical protein